MASKASRAGKTPPRQPSTASVPLAVRPQGVIGDRYRLEGTYERLRRALLAVPADGRLDRPLSYWVLPTDRTLPLALLDRPVRELLADELAVLMRTPGVGQKKILGLFDLLRRALKAHDPHAPFGLPGALSTATRHATQDAAGTKDRLAEVSEAAWSLWTESVRRGGMHDCVLGRVAPCLQSLPSVIWQKPLGDYATRTLAEVRQMKTHGEKRVQAILEVFLAVHEALSTAVLDEHLEVVVQPRFVPAVNRWLVLANKSPRLVGAEDLQRRVIAPLLEQVAHDLGQEVAQVAAERLATGSRASSVKQQAARLSVTRARIYQLLEECAAMAAVRWPEGRWLLAPLAEGLAPSATIAHESLVGVQALFFPEECV
ncbi:hypothetical protein [Botrimarina hoheduenensis]|uniref:Uncharacterized protein n=1 Tax=Botrimarina hoheduenensis TaxID=2528000 RepID=A0A5C5W9W9_9BACT|nr:hypothetical protein [Botrimarina hoheduenensis]TWT46422.1 hypothetical protein Pla111_15180 [Botrimarina hoheduenensis]